MPPVRTLLLLAGLALAGPAVTWADCSTPAATAGSTIFNTTYKVMQYCNGTSWVNTGAVISDAAQTGCASPTGQAGNVYYNRTLGMVQFCNGSSWVNTACANDRVPNGSGCTTPTGKAGTMRYDNAANQLQFCDSTNWVNMGYPCGPVCFNSWSLVSSLTTNPWRSIDIDGNGNIMIIRSTGNIYYSSDTGATWQSQGTPAGNNAINTFALAGSRSGAVFYLGEYHSVNGGTGVSKTIDGGSTFSAGINPVGTNDVKSVAVNSDGTKAIISAANSALYYTSNSGVTWANVNSSTAERHFAMSSDGSKILALSYWAGYASKLSTDSGASWTDITDFGTQQMNAGDMDDSGQTMVAGGTSSYLFLSTNGGSTWTAQTALGTRSWYRFKVSSDGKRIAALSNSSNLFFSSDTGTTWRQITLPASYTNMTMDRSGSRIFAISGTQLYTSTCQ